MRLLRDFISSSDEQLSSSSAMTTAAVDSNVDLFAKTKKPHRLAVVLEQNSAYLPFYLEYSISLIYSAA